MRFDYMSLDTGRNRLYISHMNDGHVIVYDVKAQRVVANIPGIPGCTGVLGAPELDRVFASASQTGQIAVIDAGALQVVANIYAGEFPDGIAYDPVHQKLYVSDEAGGSEIVIDARGGRYLSTIPLGGGVGNTQYDRVTGRIFVTVGQSNQLVAIDPGSDRVVARYPLPGADHPHGLCLDAAHRLAFIACEGNARLIVVGMGDMKVTSVHGVGQDPDVLAFDPGPDRLYVASESGMVSVFVEKDHTLVKQGDMFVAGEAHSVAVDPRTHLVFLPLENVGGHPVLRIMAPN